jgi:hypothetical protein
LPVLAREYGLFKQVFASLDTNLGVVDVDDVNQKLQIGLPEWHRAGANVFAHNPAEQLDQGRINFNLWRRMLHGPFESPLAWSRLALSAFRRSFSTLVSVGEAVLDQPVKALEFVIGISHFRLQPDRFRVFS